jgi:hypothetical protein
MNSMVWKSGIVAAFLILSQCGHTASPTTTLNPIMSLTEKWVHDTSLAIISTQVIISTTAAGSHLLYRVEDTCTLTYTWHATKIDGSDSAFIVSVPIANDSAASQAGTFHGIWVVPDSLLIPGALSIYGCVLDEANHDACDSLVVYKNTSLPY